MTTARDSAPGDNPFSAQRVRPGTLVYRFPPGLGAQTILKRFQQGGSRGQIIGPHGSGKSTLLATLVPALEHQGRSTLVLTLHDGQRRLPSQTWLALQLPPGGVLVIDGYEQLSPLSRLRLRWLCRRRRLGLIVTAHHGVGLPELLNTTTDVSLAQTLVADLLGRHDELITPEEVAARFEHHQGNLRELLFEMYDLYEARRARDRE